MKTSLTQFYWAFIVFLGIVCFSSGSSLLAEEGNSISMRLSNGLDVVMIEDHSAPLISVFVAIKSGSATETYRQNGITHLLEHMLFNGTETRTQEELYDEMDLIGGYNNAYTRKDYTTFIITMPTRNIEKGMDIQSDMLFKSIFNPEKTTKELGIITEEIRRDSSNPDYAIESNFDAWLYENTPYEKTTLGIVEGIQKLGADEIKNYWSQFYSPNNMTLIVMGDFKPAEMIQLVEKYYGKAQPSDLPEKFKGSFKPITKNEIKIDYVPNSQRTIKMAMNAVRPTDENGSAFKLMVDLISDEMNTFLAEQNSSEPLQVYPEIVDTAIGSRLIFSGNIPNSYSDDDAVNLLMETLIKSGNVKTDAKKLEIAKISSIASEIKMRENTMYFGMFSVGDAVMWGWDYVQNKERRISDITVQQIDLLRSEYFLEPEVMAYIAKPLPDAAAESDKIQTNWKTETLDNGLVVAIKQDNASEVFGLHLLVKNRCWLEPEGMDGMVDLLHRTLTSGTTDMSSEEIQMKLDSLGMDIKTNDFAFVPFDDYYLDPEYSYVRVTGLDRFWKENIGLVAHLIQSDGITDDILKSARADMMRSIVPQAMMTSTVAKRDFKSQLYGDSPLTKPIVGNGGTLNKITLDVIKEFRQKYFAPDNMILTIVTSENPEEIMTAVRENFGKMNKSNLTFNKSDVKLKMEREPEYLSEMGGKQSNIIFSFPIETLPKEDRIPLMALGDIISKEVAFELREKQGLAYSIGASFNPVGNSAYFYLSMGTGPENVETAKTGIKSVLANIKTKVLTQRDVDLAVNATAAQMIRYRVKRENQAYYMGYNIFRGEDLKYSPIDKWYLLKLEDVLRVRDKYLKPETGYFVIAK